MNSKLQNLLALPSCTKHNTCKKLSTMNVYRAAGAAMLLPYNLPNGTIVWVMLVGRETGGKYQGEFSLCSGSGEVCDINSQGEYCWLETHKRELREEYKINAPFDGTFDKLFKGPKGIRVFIHNRTPIFVGVLPNGTSRAPIKQQMLNDCSNDKLPHSWKEMDDAEYIRIYDGTQLEGKSIIVSSYADAVRRKIDLSRL
jgi:hypothetical protein